MMWRTVSALATVVLVLAAGCGSPAHGGGPAGHGDHDVANDPRLVPAGSSGTPALGQPVESMRDLSTWVQRATGECASVSGATMDDLADYLGPTRVPWYEPYVAEWATCAIEPYDKLGLVLFKPGQQRELQASWLRGLRSGRITDNPDWAFGNGFAITAGPLGAERLGLRYLWCEPVEVPDAETIPADVDGCVYATVDHHS
jgi:hypothetical protein